jgi:hypothetical protein
MLPRDEKNHSHPRSSRLDARALVLLAAVLLFAARAIRRRPPAVARAVCPTVYSHRGGGASVFEDGSLAAMLELARRGVCHFDLDAFESVDRELVVSHPASAAVLSAAGGREPDALSRSELAALPTLTEVARALADEPCGGADRTLPRLTVELKGASATPGGARAVAAVARATGLDLALVTGADGGGALVAEALRIDLPQVHAVKAWGRDPSLSEKLTREELPKSGLAAVAPALSLVRGSPLPEPHPPLIVWIVDDREALVQAVGARARAVISNRPLHIRELLLSMEGLCVAPGL